MIKLIIFDLSGVIGNAEEPIYLEKFAKKYDISLDELKKIYYACLEKSEKNEIPLREVWEKTLNKFNIKGNYKNYAEEMMDLKEFDKEALDFIFKLKKSYKTAYFTNYAEEYWKIHEKLIDLSKYFDFGVVSYKIGSRKPEPKGFKAIMRHFKAKPRETIFIDDTEKNLKNAKELGIKTIHFRSLRQLKNELKKLNVKSWLYSRTKSILADKLI